MLKVSSKFHYLKEISKHYFGGLYDRIDRHHVFLLAGGLAFSLFVCIIPFTLIIFWFLGNILTSSAVELQINTLIDTIIPYEKYAEFVKSVIYKRIFEVIEYKNIAGFIGIIGLFFAASGFFSSLRTVLNKVFGLETDVNVVVGKLRDFALIIIVILIFMVSTLFLPLIDVLRSASVFIPSFEFLQYGIFQKIFTSAASLVIVYLLFSTMYRFIPIQKIRKRSVLVGSLWAAFFWEAAKQVFGYYLSNFAMFGKIYGTYALVVVVAFWIYYSAAVFIIGAEIGKLFDERLNASIERRKKRAEIPS